MTSTRVTWERRLLCPTQDQDGGIAAPKVYSFYNILLEQHIAPAGGKGGKWAVTEVVMRYLGSCPVTLRLQKSIDGAPSLKPPHHALSVEIEGTPSKGIEMKRSELSGGESSAVIHQRGPFVIEGPATADGPPAQDLVGAILFNASCDAINSNLTNSQGKSTWYGVWTIEFQVKPFQAGMSASASFVDRYVDPAVAAVKTLAGKAIKRGKKALATGNFAERMKAAKAAKAKAKGKFGAKSKQGKKVAAKGKYGKKQKNDMTPKL